MLGQLMITNSKPLKDCIYSKIILNRIVRWSIVPYIDVLSRNDMHSFILD